jgi:hypothetical protein
MTMTPSFIDHKSHAQSHIKPFPDRLHVVTAISNPQRFRSRYELFWAFEKRVRDAGAILHVAEVAFGGRPFEVTEPDNPNHLQLRTDFEIWHKENALNLLISNAIRLHPEAKYFAWVDADVQFARPDWAQETLHQLQHYHVVQMWSMCQDLSAGHEVIQYDDGGEQLPGMVYQHIQAGMYGKYSGGASRIDPDDPYSRAMARSGKRDFRFHPGHSGYAWAATRYALDTLGGLIDWSVCGANDHHMARGLLGDIMESVSGGSSPAFKESLRLWGQRAEQLKPKVGYVPGLITHFWHGPKRNRQYLTRWRILNESQFDPALDLKRDAQGLYQLTGRNKKLIADLMAYFRQRNEDSIDV